MPSGEKSKVSFKEVLKRFSELKEIMLCVETYDKWTSECMFYDLVINEYFYSTPIMVYKYKRVHPKRAMQNRFAALKEKLKKEYGVVNYSQLQSVKDKKKQTCLSKWGIECNLQDPTTLKTIKENWKEKFGTEYPFQNEQVKDKIKNTLLERYNVDNISKSDVFLKQVSNRFIVETGEFLGTWYDKFKDKKPSYETLVNHFPNENINLNELLDFCKSFKEGKTELEYFTENLLNVKHFNKEIGIKKYRPDFKLSDKIYMNVDGLYWHSNTNIKMNKEYHFDLRKDFEDNGLTMLQFRDYELYNKKEVVKSIIDKTLFNISVLDLNTKILEIFDFGSINEDINKFIDINSIKNIELDNKRIFSLSVNKEAMVLFIYHIDDNQLIIDSIVQNIKYDIRNYLSQFIDFIKVKFCDIRGIGCSLNLRHEQYICNEFIDNEFDVLGDELIPENINRYIIFDAGKRKYIKNI